MIIFVLLLCMIVISKSKMATQNNFNHEYMSIQQTNVMKGIFVILVLLGHSSAFTVPQGALDDCYVTLRNHLGQMVVAMFLFYSGYGMLISIQKKKYSYIKEFPVKRFLTVFLHFDFAVLLFVLMNKILGITYDWKTILLAFTGWTEIGNSNWYMFVIFCLYILFFISFLLLKRNSSDLAICIGLIIFTILSIGFILFEIYVDRPAWFYNTVILFPLGSWYALLKDKIDKILLKNDYIYTLAIVIVGVLYYMTVTNRWRGLIYYFAWACIFTMTVVLLTMKVSIHSTLLEWFGSHIFSIYILQRIPMTILCSMGLEKDRPYSFVMLVLLITIGLAVVFDYYVGKLDQLLIKKRS